MLRAAARIAIRVVGGSSAGFAVLRLADDPERRLLSAKAFAADSNYSVATRPSTLEAARDHCRDHGVVLLSNVLSTEVALFNPK